MNTFEQTMQEFYEFFNIDNVEVREPGRAVDDDGEICEYYIDYVSPTIDPVFMDLLHYYYGNLGGSKIFISGPITPNSLTKILMEVLVGVVKNCENNGIDMSDEKEDIKEIVECTYGVYDED